MSQTEASTDVEFSACSRTTCQLAMARGCQTASVVAADGIAAAVAVGAAAGGIQSPSVALKRERKDRV